jgi:hypothetical protein
MVYLPTHDPQSTLRLAIRRSVGASVQIALPELAPADAWRKMMI